MSSLITLLKPHTHAGVLHAIGEEIDVLGHDAAWLVEQGIGKFTGIAPSASSLSSTPDQPDTLE